MDEKVQKDFKTDSSEINENTAAKAESVRKGNVEKSKRPIDFGNLVRDIVLFILIIATTVLFISNIILKNRIATLDKNMQFIISLVNNDISGQGEKLELLQQKVDEMTSSKTDVSSSSTSSNNS